MSSYASIERKFLFVTVFQVAEPRPFRIVFPFFRIVTYRLTKWPQNFSRLALFLATPRNVSTHSRRLVAAANQLTSMQGLLDIALQYTLYNLFQSYIELYLFSRFYFPKVVPSSCYVNFKQAFNDKHGLLLPYPWVVLSS